MSARTPGPWVYEGAEAGGRVLATDERRTVVHVPPASPHNPQCEADARLIAASPDLLVSLDYLVILLEEFDTGELGPQVMEAIGEAREVMRRARGRS
jgi:hypothetical protein